MKIFGTLMMLAGLTAMSAMVFCHHDDGNSFKCNERHLLSTGTVASAQVEPSEHHNAANDEGASEDRRIAPTRASVDRLEIIDNAVEPAAFQDIYTGDFTEGFTETEGISEGFIGNGNSDGNWNGGCVQCEAGQNVKKLIGVDDCNHCGREPGWSDQHMIPWESFAYGEYIGPYRTPHVGEYRIRVDDRLEFVYMLTREKTMEPYRFYVGDLIQIASAIDESLNQTDITVLSDGTISLNLIGQVNVAGKTLEDLQNELNEKYSAYVKNPGIVVSVLKGDTPLEDLRDAVDARQGLGGQNQRAIVSPDGTIQLPLIGSVPAIGLTLDEMRREVNARYHTRVRGIGVTPILSERAPRYVFVVGEVSQPGRFELTGPTTVTQALALAGGFNVGGNVRQAIVFRRDQNWKLIATRLDIAGVFYGKRPHPSDDVWLRDSDIVLIPKTPILRWSEAVNLYITRSVYAIFPQQGFAFGFDGFTTL